jgi:hypothetical protein
MKNGYQRKMAAKEKWLPKKNGCQRKMAANSWVQVKQPLTMRRH